ncbi:MAG TPA: integrase arm-type DNA-binding domain-containing protein, partial [Acetobacteraceae bacterium]|nr:integrase arm-type DNA-binding domain-containing protein [Acetobacteraceae bacterium]
MSCSAGPAEFGEQDTLATGQAQAMGVTVTSEGPVKITRAVIEAAWKRRAPGRRLVVRDAECRGLALIVNPTAMAWSYAYRPRGADPATGRRWPNRSVTLGNPASHSPEAARHAANELKGKTAAGHDPAAERRARAAEAAKRTRTIGHLLDAYAAALPTRPKLRGSGLVSPGHAADEVANARVAVALMNAVDKPVADLTVADL